MNNIFKNWTEQLPEHDQAIVIWVKNADYGYGVISHWVSAHGVYCTRDHYTYEDGEERMILPCFIDHSFLIDGTNLYPYYYIDGDTLVHSVTGDRVDVYWADMNAVYGPPPADNIGAV